jgi:hypothetical protein
LQFKICVLREMRLVGLIEHHARMDRPGQWTAAAWLLKRRFPHHWSRRRCNAAEKKEKPAEPEQSLEEIIQIARQALADDERKRAQYGLRNAETSNALEITDQSDIHTLGFDKGL